MLGRLIVYTIRLRGGPVKTASHPEHTAVREAAGQM